MMIDEQGESVVVKRLTAYKLIAHESRPETQKLLRVLHGSHEADVGNETRGYMGGSRRMDWAER